MAKIRKIPNWLLISLVLSIALVKLGDARAKAGFWDDDSEEEEDDFWGGGEGDESKEKDDTKPRAVQPALSAPVMASQDNHDHHVHVQSAPIEPKQDWSGGDGFSAANFAAHNESCGPREKSCIPRSNLECSATDGTGRCVCIIGWVYVRETESCWRIPKSSEDECAHHVQCQSGSWGENSMCNKRTARCECHDWVARRDMVLVDGVCYVNKTVGALCDTDDECDKPIKGDAHCEVGDHDSSSGHRYKGSCQCHPRSVWFNPLKECLKRAEGLNSPCVVTHQCREGALGDHSLCEAETSRCKCWNHTPGENKTEAIYYEKMKKCFLRKEYNETCTEDVECQASLGPDVKCGPTEFFENEDVCHCPKGKVCRGAGVAVQAGQVGVVALAILTVLASFK